ncbi:hypothetical protein H6P81_018595 [Aristolochia fimbriata]|uniref:PGG domain-containing protein n=1 Tax=Aristolochia fimbriata TaxID=158543 RepID=A0AAV7E4Q3_ARIFI|nr:hypothetical protein H6P81_018595 [Aristolochia fimbriata]
MEPLSPPSPGKFLARSFRRRLEYSEDDHVVIQVLADEVTIQLIADHVRIETHVSEDQIEGDQKRVRKGVLKITGSIVAIVSAVLGLVDIDPPPNIMGFSTLNRLYPFKLAFKGCFLAVMLCFCFSLGLLMLSEVAQRPPISIPMARKLMLLVLTLVQLTVALKTAALLM